VIHGGQQSCDVLPFSPPPPARGHYTPKAVSREKVEKLGGVAHSSPSTRLWVGMFWQSIPVARHDCRAALSDGGSEMQSCKSKLCQNGERTADPRRHESVSSRRGPRARALDCVAPRNAVGSWLRFNFSDAAIRLGSRDRHNQPKQCAMPHAAPIDSALHLQRCAPTEISRDSDQTSGSGTMLHVDTNCCRLTARAAAALGT
jgi:hypothetical protein